jgi:hypothetical protein
MTTGTLAATVERGSERGRTPVDRVRPPARGYPGRQEREVTTMLSIARLVRLVTAVVVLTIVAGIAIHVFDISTQSSVIDFVEGAAAWLASPFQWVFDTSDEKLRYGLNWGLAALVYAIVGGVIASLLTRAALGGERRRGFGWRRRPVEPY